jgi:hypothetical protein
MVATQMEGCSSLRYRLGVLSSPLSNSFVTTSQGSFKALPLHFSPDSCTPVKCAVANFAQSVWRRSSPGVLRGSPLRRRLRVVADTSTPSIRRSHRLAKKSRQRASKPVIQAQNVLMKRLGVTSPPKQPDSSAFQRFLEVFTSTLTPSQCESLGACLICRLWKAWPANQALASQSLVRNGQWPCLMFLYDLSLAQAFCLFDSECGAWPKAN